MDSHWRNRAEFLSGREAIVAFLTRKWNRELDYRLIKELWTYNGNRIAVRFAYEYHDDSGQWFRSYGNENWEFNEEGLMRSASPASTSIRIAEIRAQVSLAARPPPGRPPPPERARFQARRVQVLHDFDIRPAGTCCGPVFRLEWACVPVLVRQRKASAFTPVRLDLAMRLRYSGRIRRGDLAGRLAATLKKSLKKAARSR